MTSVGGSEVVGRRQSKRRKVKWTPRCLFLVFDCKIPNLLFFVGQVWQTCKMWGGSLCALKRRERPGLG